MCSIFNVRAIIISCMNFKFFSVFVFAKFTWKALDQAIWFWAFCTVIFSSVPMSFDLLLCTRCLGPEKLVLGKINLFWATKKTCFRPRKNLFLAIKRLVLGQKKLVLCNINLFLATKKLVFGHKKTCFWPRKNLFWATKKLVFGHEKTCFWPEKTCFAQKKLVLGQKKLVFGPKNMFLGCGR